MNATAKKIRDARIKSGLSEKQLGKKCGVTGGYIQQVESGKKIINESIAMKILKVLKVDLDSLTQETTASKEARVIKPKPVVKKKVVHTEIDHAPSWGSALDNIIRKYPIYNILTQKSIGVKTISTLDKKIDGYHCDKLSFVEVDDNALNELGIIKNDVVMINLSTNITNNKIYYIEMNNKFFIRKLRKEQNNKVIISIGHDKNELLDINKVKIIGECVKIERFL